jgi:ADP-ribosylglycohydrolase
MKDNAKAMVMAAFAGDSLALGVHWIYDTRAIAENFGRVDHLLPPGPNSYHATKAKGDLTHYGDQMLVLLESVAERGGFDLDDFSERWRTLFQDYSGYVDQATTATLNGFAAGKGSGDAGSSSDEIAGAARMVPVVMALRDDPEGLLSAVEAQTRMTHNNALTLESAMFFAETARRVLNGTTPLEAMKGASGMGILGSRTAQWVAQGLDSAEQDTLSALLGFGQNCHTPHALPGIVHLIAAYQRDLKEALVQAVMAGGDSAARCMMTGMVLGAHLGWAGLPGEWVSGLRKRDRILELLDKVG